MTFWVIKMKTENFAVFILTHGRADTILTDKTLRRQGYTGAIFYICDDEDEQLSKYKEKFGSLVLVFNKETYREITDTMDNGVGQDNIVVYARNATFDLAKDLGIEYFLMLDDDYSSISYRFEDLGILAWYAFKNLDKFFDSCIDFLLSTDSDCLALTQGGDFIGGLNGQFTKKALLRKVMNAFFFRTDKPQKFLGRLNEDVNYYVLANPQGKRVFSLVDVMIVQGETQQREGGLTEAYLDIGTYAKSFYSVMCNPSAVKVKAMGNSSFRIHHAIDWNACAPCILNEKWRKVRHENKT